jgi:steroid 5-alpha reductase family enzyme
MLDDLIRLALIDAAIVFGSFSLLWAISMATRDSSLVDIWFSPCIAIAAVVGAVVAGGAEPRRVLLGVLASVWALRLGGYLLWRNWGREDPRYARFRKHIEDQGRNFAWHSFTRINLYQGAIVFLALAPFIVAQTAPEPAQLGLLARLGAALTLFGVAFQGISDWQLARFKADPANAGKVLDTGLWRYSRHPQLFRRELRLVGLLARRLRGAVGLGHRDLAGVHDLVDPRHDGQGTGRATHAEEAPRLRGLRGAHQRLHPLVPATAAGRLNAGARRGADRRAGCEPGHAAGCVPGGRTARDAVRGTTCAAQSCRAPSCPAARAARPSASRHGSRPRAARSASRRPRRSSRRAAGARRAYAAA